MRNEFDKCYEFYEIGFVTDKDDQLVHLFGSLINSPMMMVQYLVSVSNHRKNLKDFYSESNREELSDYMILDFGYKNKSNKTFLLLKKMEEKHFIRSIQHIKRHHHYQIYNKLHKPLHDLAVEHCD
jgi:hypothetical protein